MEIDELWMNNYDIDESYNPLESKVWIEFDLMVESGNLEIECGHYPIHLGFISVVNTLVY
jgi:hypothetical protein